MLAFRLVRACHGAMNRHQPACTRLLRQLVDELELVLDLDVVLRVLRAQEEKQQMDRDGD